MLLRDFKVCQWIARHRSLPVELAANLAILCQSTSTRQAAQHTSCLARLHRTATYVRDFQLVSKGISTSMALV